MVASFRQQKKNIFPLLFTLKIHVVLCTVNLRKAFCLSMLLLPPGVQRQEEKRKQAEEEENNRRDDGCAAFPTAVFLHTATLGLIMGGICSVLINNLVKVFAISKITIFDLF